MERAGVFVQNVEPPTLVRDPLILENVLRNHGYVLMEVLFPLFGRLGIAGVAEHRLVADTIVTGSEVGKVSNHQEVLVAEASTDQHSVELHRVDADDLLLIVENGRGEQATLYHGDPGPTHQRQVGFVGTAPVAHPQ